MNTLFPHNPSLYLQLLDGANRVVDLCAAPGSWSQVISRRLEDRRATSKIVSIDLQEMAPIEGVTLVQGDITSPAVAQRVVDLFDGVCCSPNLASSIHPG